MNFNIKPWGRWLIVMSGWVFLMIAWVSTQNEQILAFLVATTAMGLGYMFKARSDEKRAKGDE